MQAAAESINAIRPTGWLKYTVNVASSGTSTLNFRLASVASGGAFHVETEAGPVGKAINVPNTGGWQNWQTVTAPIPLSPGQHTLRIVFDSAAANGFVGNFNWFSAA